MSQSHFPWFKFYSEFLHDPKIRRLSTRERYIWVGLLCLAAESPKRGKLYLTASLPMNLNDITNALCLTEADCTQEEKVSNGIVTNVVLHVTDVALQRFAELEMIKKDEGGKVVFPIEILNWEKRQGTDTPDAVRERVAKFREKKKLKPSNGNVTEVKHESNALDIDKEGDKDKELYNDMSPVGDAPLQKNKFNNEDMELARFMVEKIKENNPQFKDPNLEIWASDFNKIVRIDHRTYEQVRWLIVYAEKHEFWSRNILSPNKLRKHFDRLVLEAKSEKEKIQKPKGVTILSV